MGNPLGCARDRGGRAAGGAVKRPFSCRTRAVAAVTAGLAGQLILLVLGILILLTGLVVLWAEAI
jgi:hypothetical protein